MQKRNKKFPATGGTANWLENIDLIFFPAWCFYDANSWKLLIAYLIQL